MVACLAQEHMVRRSGFGLCKPMEGLYSLIQSVLQRVRDAESATMGVVTETNGIFL